MTHITKSVFAVCHPDRAHLAKGLCSTCYLRDYNRDHYVKKTGKGGRPGWKKALLCGHTQAHWSHGLCRKCYIKTRQKEDRLIDKRRAKKVKLETIGQYGGKCTCCGETEISFLSIDHINNDGAKHRKETGTNGGKVFYQWLKRNSYPKDNFQCLCMNCQFGKKLNGGTCPHQNVKERVNVLEA